MFAFIFIAEALKIMEMLIKLMMLVARCNLGSSTLALIVKVFLSLQHLQ